MMIDLRAEREKKKLTQLQLAERVDVQRQTISNIECGLAKPTVENAKKIAKVLEFDWTEFFND